MVYSILILSLPPNHPPQDLISPPTTPILLLQPHLGVHHGVKEDLCDRHGVSALRMPDI